MFYRVRNYKEEQITTISKFHRKDEQNANLPAAIQAVAYYNYSLGKKNVEPFKALVTEKAIAEESKEIENILGKICNWR